MTDIKKSAFLIARITQATKQMLENLAKDQNVSVSELIRTIIEEYFGEAEEA